MKLLVTGSSGFVGRQACLALSKRGFSVSAFSRTPCQWPFGIEAITASSLSSLACPSYIFEGVQCILHLAGRAHVMRETEPDPLSAFRSSNVIDTLRLAREASSAGVRRFVFLSSIKVNGEVASLRNPFTEEDDVNPSDPYAVSKYEAELGLFEIAAQTGMEVVIVRPPLIYGPGVKGNLRTMMNLLSRKVPLPLAMITDNRRSLLALDNLVDFLALCSSHPKAEGRVFLVSDQHDLSTADLLRRLGEAMGVNARLFPAPRFMLEGASNIVRKRSTYQRLCGSLVVDSSAASRLLGWAPPLALDEGLRRAAMGFVA